MTKSWVHAAHHALLAVCSESYTELKNAWLLDTDPETAEATRAEREVIEKDVVRTDRKSEYFQVRVRVCVGGGGRVSNLIIPSRVRWNGLG